MENIQIYPAPSDFESHIINMPSVTLIFSTLVLDEDIQHPVVLPKQDLKLHLSDKVRPDSELPVFHFLTICQTNSRHQSIMIIDSGQEIQFGVHLPIEKNQPVQEFSSTIITLHQPSHQTEYAPYLVNNNFNNLLQIKDLISRKGNLNTEPDQFIQSYWNAAQTIPLPTEKGNHFFPSSPFHDKANLSSPFYDVSSIPYRFANAQVYNIHPGNQSYPADRLTRFAMCENITQPSQFVYYDEIMTEVFMKNLKASELHNINQEYICCPFIFPVQCNLHHMIIHPDTLFIHQQSTTFNIFQEHRSPAFNVIAKLNTTKLGDNDALVISPVCLYAYIQEKELLFFFRTQLSSVYVISEHKEKYLTLFSRKPRKALTPKLWESDIVTFDYVVSKVDPVRINLDGSAEQPTKFLQPRTIHVDRLSPVTTVASLCTSLAPCTLGSTETTDPVEPAIKQEVIRECTTFTTNLQSYDQNEQKPSDNSNSVVNNHFPTFPTTTLNFDFPDTTCDDLKFIFDEVNPNFVPLGDPNNNASDPCLSDYLYSEPHGKIRPPRQPRHRSGPYENRSKFPKIEPPRIPLDEQYKLDTELEECLMDLDNFLFEIKEEPVANCRNLETPPPENSPIHNQNIENKILPPISFQDIVPFPTESVSWEDSFLINEPLPSEGCFSYDIHSLTVGEKNLFLFETEVHDRSIKEQQVPKMLVKLKLGNEFGQFEDITALLDSGSDVSLITLTRLKSLVSQEFIDNNIEKENAVLTSFTNTDIKIEGKLQLRFKFNNNGPVRVWKFLIISQHSALDMVIGHDMIMNFCMSIQIKAKNQPEILLPDGEPVATYYARLNEINECYKDIKLKPKQKAYIKIKPHPAFTAFRNERLLVEGTMGSAHLVVPMACKILPDGRVPLAVVNHSNKEILEKINITITRMAPDQKIVSHRDLRDLQVCTLMIPVQLSNEDEKLQIQSAVSTTEMNIYKMDVNYNPPKSIIPRRTGLAKEVKVSKGETNKQPGGPQLLDPGPSNPKKEASPKNAEETSPDEEDIYSPEKERVEHNIENI